jgi:hypothetical protein
MKQYSTWRSTRAKIQIFRNLMRFGKSFSKKYGKYQQACLKHFLTGIGKIQTTARIVEFIKGEYRFFCRYSHQFCSKDYRHLQTCSTKLATKNTNYQSRVTRKLFDYYYISLVFYLSPMLAEQYPELCSSLHAGWGAVFGKTICIEQLRRPPEIGPTTAYTDEEL